ncbi:MAG: hypothetical protein ACQKBU_06095 [Verrucomicrobiales bacterium]
MKAALLISSAALVALVTSCTPYVEVPPPVPGPDVAANNPGEAPTTEAGVSNLADTTQSTVEETTPAVPTRTDDPTPPKPESKPSTQVARPVPGKPGFVFSPFNNKLIDVKGIPSGTLVQDPTYPAEEKKYFRVP